MKRILAILACIPLSGCAITPEDKAAISGIIARAAVNAADAALKVPAKPTK